MRPEPGPDDPPMAGAPAGRRLARLAFVLTLTPGAVITMILAPTIKSPLLLTAGLILLAAALVAHRPLTAAILARAAAGRPQPPETF
jgi:hypothetical protein